MIAESPVFGTEKVESNTFETTNLMSEMDDRQRRAFFKLLLMDST